MSRRLARVVIVRNDRNEAVAFGPTDDVPEWAAAQITNVQAWAIPELPIVAQLERAGATPEELAVIRDAWAQLTDEERDDLGDDEVVSDEQVAADLADARALAAEQGSTFAAALRAAVEKDRAASTGDGAPASLVEPPPPEVAVLGGERTLDLDVEQPPRNGSKPAWIKYAMSKGATEADLADLTRDDIANRYGA